MITAFESVSQNSGQANLLDAYLSVVVRLNQYIKGGLAFHRSNGDYENALDQIEIYAFLNDLSIQLIKDKCQGNQEIWFQLNEFLKAAETGIPIDMGPSLLDKYMEWRQYVNTEVWARTSVYESPSVWVKSPGKRSSSDEDSSPSKKQNIFEDPDDDKEVQATDSSESSSSQSSPTSDESEIVASSNFEVIITEEDDMRIVNLLRCAMDQMIVKKFNLEMRGSDIRTLSGSNWLNDNVINFYMELLTERSQLNVGDLPSVYAMNSYFLQRLMTKGYWAVKRWTRKVDLLSKEIIPVPVHSNGQPAHWSMAIIDMRYKTIRYYDSMGLRNQPVLFTLLQYLEEESMDKRHQMLDTNDFIIQHVDDVPRQYNGNDCGVFCCMFAEFVTRDAPLTFNQNHMEDLRKKMMLEIVDGQLRT